MQVRTIKAARQHQRITHAQICDDRLLHPGRRCGRSRQQGRIAQSRHHFAQAQIVGPEVVPPFADTMGFIYHKPGDFNVGQRIHKRSRTEPLRGDINQLQPALPQLPQKIVLLLGGLP